MKNAFEYEVELAALREELARCRAGHTDLVDRNALLRQRPDLPVDRLPAHEKLIDLQQRLTAAERRNTELVELLKLSRGYVDEAAACHGDDKAVCICGLIDVVLKPTESGASE